MSGEMSRSSQNATPTIQHRGLPPTTSVPTSESGFPQTTSPLEYPLPSHPFPISQQHLFPQQPRRQPSFSPSTPSGQTTSSMANAQSFALPHVNQPQPNAASSTSGFYPSLGLGSGPQALPVDGFGSSNTPPPMKPAKKFARPSHAAALGETSRNLSSNSLQHLYEALRASASAGNGSGSAGGAGLGLGHGLGSGMTSHRGSIGTGPLASPSVTYGFGGEEQDGSSGMGYVSPRGLVQPLPRSRRSSVALAVSVSLASRSRSHTPVQQEGTAQGRIGSPPVSPGRNGFAGLGLGSIEARKSREGRIPSRDYRGGSGVTDGGPGTDQDRSAQTASIGLFGRRPSHSRGKSGDSATHEQEMHWEETFESEMQGEDSGFALPRDGGIRMEDVEEDASMHGSATLIDDAGREMRKLVLDSLQEEDDVSMPGSMIRQPGTASEVDSTRQPSRSTSFGSISAVDQEMADDLDVEDAEGFDTCFRKGDRFGAGIVFEGEAIEELDPVARLVAKGRSVPGGPAKQQLAGQGGFGKVFEVIKKLGSGSYAVVYLVREVGGDGQEYALKCLSKRDLEEDSLDVQLFEATIHMSLPKHDNIVTLYQTLQTGRWLFLLMEMCPGEDLFYWLEHSRDSPPESLSSTLLDPIPTPGQHAPPLSSSNLPSSAVPFSSSAMMAGMRHSPMTFSSSPALAMSKSHMAHIDTGSHHSATPTTPSLLAAYSANSLLAYRRLRLIASMFVQMCEAVSLCHQAGVSHRDIKPENFICCDSEDLASTFPDSARIGVERKKVIVKLTDFGLATTEENSGDVECGSRPYMAYECRNELGPDYAPRPADVWSLGIVWLNMLFHRNPWTDPAPGNKNFDGFLEDPVDFLLTRFTGIGREVATFLAHRVFALHCEQRVSAGELAIWAKELPAMITGRKLQGAPRTVNPNAGPREKDQLDFTKSPVDPKGHSSTFSQFSSLSQTAPRDQSIGGGAQDAEIDVGTPITVPTDFPEQEEEDAALDGDDSARTASAIKRKKRGARKGKAAQAAAAALLAGMPGIQLQPTVLPSRKEELLMDLAEASQALAREISSVSKTSDRLTMEEFPRLGEEAALVEAKKSKWKGIASLSSGNPELQALAQRVKEKEGHLSAPGKLQNAGRSASHTRAGSQHSVGVVSYTPSLTFGTSSTSSAYPSNHSIHSQTSSINDLDTWRRPSNTAKPPPPPPQPVRPAAPARKSTGDGWTGLLEQTSALSLASQIAQPLARSAGLYHVPTRNAPSIASASSKASGNSFFYRRSNPSTSTVATTVSSRSGISQFSLPPKPSQSTPLAHGQNTLSTQHEVGLALFRVDQIVEDDEQAQPLEKSSSIEPKKAKRPQALDLQNRLDAIDERFSNYTRGSDAGSLASPPHSAASATGSVMVPLPPTRSESANSRKPSFTSMTSSPTSATSPGQSPSGQKLKQQFSKIFTGMKREKGELVK